MPDKYILKISRTFFHVPLREQRQVLPPFTQTGLNWLTLDLLSKSVKHQVGWGEGVRVSISKFYFSCWTNSLKPKMEQPSQRWKLFAKCRPDFVITLWVTCSGFFPVITPPCPWECHLRFRDSSAPVLPSPARGDLCSQRFFYPSCTWGSISFVKLLQS